MKRRPALPGGRRCSPLVAVAVAPRSSRVLDRLDPGRLPQGRRREPLDRQRRPRLPRAVDRAGRRNRRAVPVDDARAARRHAVRRHRQRRPGPARSRATARSRRSSTPPSSRSTRSRRRPTAASTSPRRPTARSTRSPPTARRRRFFDPDDKYIWALAVDRTATSSPPPATKASSTRSRRTARARFYKTNTTNVVVAGVRQGRQSDRRHRIARPGVPHRRGRQGVRAARLAVQGDSRAALDADGTIYAAAINGAPGGGSAAPTVRALAETDAARPCRRSRPRSPAITRRRQRAPHAPAGPSTTRAATARRPRGAIYRIRPTGSGTRCGSRATTAPYDLLIEPDGSLLVGTGKEGKIFRLAGDPARATLLARAAAQQVTALLREPLGPHRRARPAIPGKLFALGAERAQARHLRVRRPRRRHGRDAGA